MLNECLGLYNKSKAVVHPGHKLTGPKEEEEEEGGGGGAGGEEEEEEEEWGGGGGEGGEEEEEEEEEGGGGGGEGGGEEEEEHRKISHFRYWNLIVFMYSFLKVHFSDMWSRVVW